MGSIGPPKQAPHFLVIGGGSRGNAYGRAVTAATSGKIGAVADIDVFKRREFGSKYIWGKGRASELAKEWQEFDGWKEWVDWEVRRRSGLFDKSKEEAMKNEGFVPVTGVFICTLDQTHAEIIHALAPLQLHIMCEKPLALSLGDCLSIQRVLEQHERKVVGIGHVLRYSPHNILLRKLLCEDMVIGEIVSVEHTEPVGWWHYSHSYVRGNWRRETAEGVGSLLTKACHDVDFLMWLLCSPSALTGGKEHLPTSLVSQGSKGNFRRSRKPKAAGGATNCLSCDVKESCIYSAQRIYRDKWCRQEKDTGWPLKIVVPEIEDVVTEKGWEAGEKVLIQALAEDYDDGAADEDVAKRGWYGRCVYESDNDVCDQQSLTITWEDDPIDSDKVGHGRGPKTALLHMIYSTEAQCERRGRIYGSEGEISYNSKTISVYSFQDSKTKVYTIPKQPPEVEKAHGGGDWGLAGAFVNAVEKVDSGDMTVEEAQRQYVGCDLDEIIRSHAIVFAAEESRKSEKVLRWQEWLDAKR